MTQEAIEVRGARVNNLKNISFSIPINQMTVVTGVSGSGKSSLAFDTVYAEGQRRYVESLSAYARQFLERMDKPDVDEVRGISPAIAIRQKNATRNPRSTVSTQTEIYDYLRLLYARVGTTICRVCGREVHRDSPESAADEILNQIKEGTRFFVLFPAQAGLPVVLNRHGQAVSELALTPPQGEGKPSNPRNDGTRLRFSEKFECKYDGTVYATPEPRLFSFNNPFGACPTCQGFGNTIGLDLDLVIPNPGLTLSEGAIEPWTKPQFEWAQDELRQFCKAEKLPLNVAFNQLPKSQQRAVINGKSDWSGVRGFFDWLDTKKYKLHVRVFLSKYRGYTRCPDCDGGRLRQEARDVRVGDRTLPEVSSLSIKEAAAFFDALELTPEQSAIADRVLFEIRRRLGFLVDRKSVG